MKSNKIAVCIQSEVQFFSLEPLLAELNKKYSCVKIIIRDFEDNQQGYKEMASGVRKLIQGLGYRTNTTNDIKNEKFDVCLAPYIDDGVKAKCYLKFEYGTLNIKPSLTYTPEVMERFHGFLCQSTITSMLLRTYGITFPVDNLRFYNKKKQVQKNKKEKKKLLFAPTYNDQDEVLELKKMIEILKTKYFVIIKGHHGTDYLKENLEKKNILKELADEYYDSSVSLSDLILDSDVCLFGNSSAIGEALYAGVPCAIFAKDLDCFKIGEMHTTQYQLVKNDIIPWINNAEEVLGIIKLAISDKKYKKRQKKISSELFPEEYRTGVEGYLKAIEYFINDSVVGDYLILHDYAIEERKNILQREKGAAQTEIATLTRLNEDLKQQIMSLEAELADNRKKKLYKLADKIYKIEGKIINVKD